MSGTTLRFFRRVRLLPGLRVNLSKGAPSFSVGGKGAWFTFGGGRPSRTTVGLPGTGLYATTIAGRREREARSEVPMAPTPPRPPLLQRPMTTLSWLTVALLAVLALAGLTAGR